MSQTVLVFAGAFVSILGAVISLISNTISSKTQRRTQLEIENLKISALEDKENRERKREFFKEEMQALRRDIEILQIARDIMMRIIDAPDRTYTVEEAKNSLQEIFVQIEEHYRKRYSNQHHEHYIKNIHQSKYLLIMIQRRIIDISDEVRYTSDLDQNLHQDISVAREKLKEAQEAARSQQIDLL